MFQTLLLLSLHQPWITILFLFSGEWCLKAKIWMLGVLIDTSRLLFPNPLSERVTEHTYVFTYTRKHTPFWINQLKISCLHTDISISNLISQVSFYFSPFPYFLLRSQWELWFQFSLVDLPILAKPLYITKSPLPSLVCTFFSHSMWKHCTPAAFLCGLPLQPVWTLTLLATVAPAVPYHLSPEWALALHWNWIIQEWTGKEEEKRSLLFKTALLRLI